MQQQSVAVPVAARTVRPGPFHRALSEAVNRRGLSLSRLRAHLAAHGVSVAESTLSYWQRGLRSPSAPRSLEVVRALESVLGLPADSLVVLIGPHRTTDSERRPSLPELQQSWAETCALREELSGTPSGQENADLDVATVVDEVTLGGHGRTAKISSTMVVRARRSGPDSFLVTHQDEKGSDVTGTSIVAVDGCRVGRVRRSKRSAGMVFELLFDRGLTEGETHTFGFTLRPASSVRPQNFHRIVRSRMSAYLLRLHFDPGALPARCLRTIRPREDLDPLVREPLFCAPGSTASAYFEELGVGIAGVDLIWD